MQVAPRVVQLVVQLFELLIELPGKLKHPAGGFRLTFRTGGIERLAGSEHRFLDLLRNDRTDFAQVFADRVHFQRRPHEKLEVAFKVARMVGGFGSLGIKTSSNEVEDIHLRSALAVAIHAPVPLFHTVGIPRHFIMNEPVAMVLEIEAFGSCICGQ